VRKREKVRKEKLRGNRKKKRKKKTRVKREKRKKKMRGYKKKRKKKEKENEKKKCSNCRFTLSTCSRQKEYRRTIYQIL